MKDVSLCRVLYVILLQSQILYPPFFRPLRIACFRTVW